MDIFTNSLAVRHNVGFLQEVADRMKEFERRDIQFLDIKELNDLVGDYRARIKDLIAHHRALRAPSSSRDVRQAYQNHESIFIRRQITDLWKLYQMARSDSRELTEFYMRRLNTVSYAPSHPPEKAIYRAAA